MIGLLSAVKKYDWRSGNRFSTFATYWIRQAIDRAVADKGRAVRLPVHVYDMYRRVKRERVRWAHEHGGIYPDNATLAPIVHLSERQLADIDAISMTECISIEAAVNDDDEDQLTLGQMLCSDEMEEPENAVGGKSEYLQAFIDIADLSEREYRVLDLRFGLTSGEYKTLKQVSIVEHVTRERIRQIEMKALTKLRCAADRLARKGQVWEDIA